MAFYDQSKEERKLLVEEIRKELQSDIALNKLTKLVLYFSDADTYIRKTAYEAVGKLYKEDISLQTILVESLTLLIGHTDPAVRQTAINAAGEIGIHNFEVIEFMFDKCLFDDHHSVRNAVIGSVKKMGKKNPRPVLTWARKYLHHPNKEVRREICHGIELRGRTHPEDILNMLQELQYDETNRVRNTLIHVLGQISYKKDCLPKVIHHLNGWQNKGVVKEAAEEIIDVHRRYNEFAVLTPSEVRDYIEKNLII